ncbi:DMT family transporter [Yoonia sediminilitoris]|uniref:DMT family transporter n=1 Tax=Yoonia sediminilitoris TaxID=1286148 RepID=UPI000D3836D1|nr:DMT family transporter [Yoonia sediminilitoris]
MPAQKTLSTRAWGELLLLSIIWGASFLSIRVALDEISPLTAVAHRTGWAMLILWAYIFYRRLPLPSEPKVWAAFLVMGLLNNVIPFSLIAWGQLHIETGLTSILNAATAIFGVILAALCFADERLTRRRLIGASVGFVGVAMAIGLSALKQFDLRSLAQLAVVAGTISYALASVWARKMLVGLRPQVAAAGMLTGASLITVPLAWVVEGPISLDLQPQTWAAIGYYAVVATAIAYLLYYRVLAMAGSGNLMLCTLLVAPVAIILGAILLGERLSFSAYLGFMLLALGLIIIDGRLPVTIQYRLRRAQAGR